MSVHYSVLELRISRVIPMPRAFTSGARDLTATCCCFRLVQVLPGVCEIIPVRVHRLNELCLFLAAPTFDFLLASDCCIDTQKLRNRRDESGYSGW